MHTTEFYKNFQEDIPLEQLPVMNKEKYRSNYDAHYSSMYKNANDNRIMSTSGSTGTPFSVVQDKNKIMHNTAASIFLGTAGGYYIGMKEAFIRMWVGDHSKKNKLQKFAENLIMVDFCNWGDNEIGHVISMIRDRKVSCIIGYSSALTEISRYIEQYQINTTDFSVKAILPISESMPLQVREKLKKQFRCPVRAWYSNEENGIMGIQNEDDGEYYIDTESYYYEILKLDCDKPAEDGEIGRIVITDLYNYAFPMIRYDNGDLAIARKETADGRYKLFLKELYGRRTDMLYDCEGKIVSPILISNLFASRNEIRQYLFIQEDVSKYTLRLNGNKEQINADELVGMLYPFFGKHAKINVEYVDEIPVLNSGKRKFTENHCEKYR